MMTQSSAGEKMLKEFEGCRLVAYQDGGGVWTCGWGHTGKGVVSGLTISQACADAWYARDIAGAVNAVNHLVTVPLTQEQFDALVSFTYNLGSHAFATSTLLRLLNNRDYGKAANEFLRWDHDNGKVVAGLTRRRKAEHDLFLTTDKGTA